MLEVLNGYEHVDERAEDRINHGAGDRGDEHDTPLMAYGNLNHIGVSRTPGRRLSFVDASGRQVRADIESLDRAAVVQKVAGWMYLLLTSHICYAPEAQRIEMSVEN